MPFVYDNSSWKLIDDEEPYDEERFFVVKKLHIVPTKHFVQEFSVDQIRRCVQKFGEIESIELLKNGKAAHVTFVSDRTAYLMQLQHEFDKKMENEQPFQVRPADSSQQTRNDTDSSPEIGIEQSSEIFKLDEETLLYLFKFLDIDSAVSMADVCKLFSQLMVHHHFPMIRKFKFNYHLCYPFAFAESLAQLYRTLDFIGKYITELTVHIFVSLDYDDLDYLRFNSQLRRILFANIGTNLRRASFSNLFHRFDDDGISYLTPILSHLEHLEINEFDFFDEGPGNAVNFQTICPNLVEFKLNGAVRMTRCEKPWDRLRCLSITGTYLRDNEEILQSYFAWNPQLTCVEFDLHLNYENIFSELANLHSLEKLSIHCDYTINHYKAFFGGYYVETTCLHQPGMARLKDLQHLTEITLRTSNCSVDLNRVFDCWSSFVGLRKIRLACNANEQIDEQSLVNLARLPNLEHFIMEINIELISKASLVNFVRVAGQLKILELYHFSMELTLVDISKCERPGTLRELNSSEFMHLTAFGNAEAQSFLED